jgi:Phage integrase family
MKGRPDAVGCECRNSAYAPAVFASWRTFGEKPLRSTAVLVDYIKPAAERAGLGTIGWHSFRRTFSTLLRSNGVDIKVQQELMRHADIRTTMNLYTQANSDQIKRAQREIVQGVLAPCSPVLPQDLHLLDFGIFVGGRYRIRTYDFHRVKMALYR